jgi:hypothetical protein
LAVVEEVDVAGHSGAGCGRRGGAGGCRRGGSGGGQHGGAGGQPVEVVVPKQWAHLLGFFEKKSFVKSESDVGFSAHIRREGPRLL